MPVLSFHTPRPGLIPSGLLFTLCLYLSLFWGPPAVQAKEGPPSPVTLAEVTQETLSEQVPLSGTSIPFRRVMLSPRVEGLVSQVLVDEGSWVRQEDPILSLDASLAGFEVRMTEAQVQEALARHRNAIRIRDELQRLKKGRHASETSIESAIAEVKITAAALSRARVELGRAQELKARHSVSAPFAGMVVSKQVETGQWVRRNDPVVELVAVDTLRVRAPLPQRFYSRVSRGAKALVRFDALPEREFEGRVFARIASGNERSRSFPLLIDIPNPDLLLAPGMSARLLVELEGTAAKALTVPRDAVVAKANGQRQLWRIRKDDGVLKAFPVTIKTARAQGDRLELVGSELQAGDHIVLLGNENLRPGQAVSPRAGTPTSAGGQTSALPSSRP